MAPHWNCECCCEDFHDYTSTEIEGSRVCPACVREMFDKALKFEHEYPPRWSDIVHPSEFSHIFSADYIERYKHKEIEYKTQPSKRVYCQYQVERVVTGEADDSVAVKEVCGGFVGVRQKPSKADVLVLGRCKECKNASCMVCDEIPCDPLAILQHVCMGKSLANQKRAQAFIGLKRGKDWQVCPSRQCGRRIELSEACNHITCNCGTGFCFICGQEAEGDSEHWTSRKSGCPRYNHPDDIDAEYDEGSEYDEEEASPTEDELADDSDPLDNVRDLFAVGEDGATTSVTTSETTAIPAPVFPAGVSSSPHLALEHNHLENDALADMPPQGTLGFSFGEDKEGDTTSTTPGVTQMSIHDAEAIASAYWEDDWNDSAGFIHEISGNGNELVVTEEEEDIDRALWRMRIE